MARIGERYRSKEFDYVVEIMEVRDGYKVLQIVESNNRSKEVGRTLHASSDWPTNFNHYWERVPSKSENFTNLYDKLCGTEQ